MQLRVGSEQIAALKPSREWSVKEEICENRVYTVHDKEVFFYLELFGERPDMSCRDLIVPLRVYQTCAIYL